MAKATLSRIMKRGHEIARTLEGNYQARLSYGLKVAWAEYKGGNKVKKVSFEKNGIYFEVVAEGTKAKITANGVTAHTDAYKSRRAGDIWVYNIEDKAFSKALGARARIMIAHDSAKEINEYIEKAKAQEKEEEKAKKEQEIADIKAGKKKIKVSYYDGIYLSAYTVHGIAAELLEGLGLSKYITGWGNRVDGNLVKALGEEFTYADAVEFSRPARNAEMKKQEEKETAVQAKFEEAKETGKPVEVQRYTTDCNNPRKECSTDIITIYAMPDGTTKETRTHTY